MSTSSCRSSIGIVAFALAASSGACSSSTPLKKTTDAATATDLGSADILARDSAADLAGSDAIGPDLVGPDLSRADGLSLDTLVMGKDASLVADLPVGNDTFVADLPSTVTDAPSNDLSGGDVPASDSLPRDGAADGLWGCRMDASGPPSCNDSPISSAVMGTCQPNGTCVCASPYVINPSTGRCMYPLRDGSVPSDTGAATVCSGDYTACGCGCCGGVSSTLACYYPSLGENIAAITAQDQATKSATNCDLAGCSRGTRYVCCAEPAPESSSSAAYTAEGYSGGLDHVTISKSGSDCARLSFARPLSGSTSPVRMNLPATWGVVSGEFGLCGDAGTTTQAKGGVGTLALRASGSQCLADLHATLFALAADGTVTASRLDVDGVAVTGLPGNYCP